MADPVSLRVEGTTSPFLEALALVAPLHPVKPDNAIKKPSLRRHLVPPNRNSVLNDKLRRSMPVFRLSDPDALTDQESIR